ncbi:MAG: acyl-CoA synthetase [Candidatus Rokubacteria bacterium]|nr:acyl-CoA synthetase [Candidatus Rokubacteria bacterium]
MHQEALALPPDYLRIPDRLNVASVTVDRHVAAGRGDRVALLGDAGAVTYRELQRRVNRCGNALARMGIGRGDRFFLRAPNSPEYLVTVLAGLKIGAVPIPTNSLFRAWELEHLINNSEAKAVFTTPGLAGAVEEVWPRCPTLKHAVMLGADAGAYQAFEAFVGDASDRLEAADTAAGDLAFIMYTSGTTGKPKGVEHAHRWIVGAGEPVVRVMMQLGEHDVCLQPQEISFMYSWGCGFLFPLYAGCATVVYAGRFDVDRALAAIERHRATVFVAVPTIFRMLLARPGVEREHDLSSVRMAISGGEPLPGDTYHDTRRRFGFEIFDSIGQTEIHLYLGGRPGMPIKPGSMGTPFPGHTVSVVDDDGREVGPETVGHLVIRNDDPGLTLGYRRMEERWAELNRGGWFYTGDLARKDADGYYWYVSRSDDLIKSRAYLISPKEVEEATMEHPAVLEAGVVGIPDDMLGQRVKAFVALKPGYQASPALAEEIVEKVKGVIAAYKAPREVEFMQELPKTATGKILRRELRSRDVR